MASQEVTPSPRDHEADANPKLARKRQKLSPFDGEASLSPDGSVVVEEVTDPDDLGGNMNAAIEIEAEPAEPYANDFGLAADDRLHKLHSQLEQNQYIKFTDFDWLSQGLIAHLENTTDDKHAWKSHYLDDEVDFFTHLGLVLHRLVVTPDLFESSFDIKHEYVQESYSRVVRGACQICQRILPLLPNALTTILSRRDSALALRRPQAAGTLYYIVTACRLSLALRTTPVQQFMQHDRKGRLQFLADAVDYFVDDEVVGALAEVFNALNGAMRELQDSWWILQHGLNLFRTAILRRERNGDFPRPAAEAALHVVHGSIRATVAGKHPGALPDGFHEDTVHFGEDVLAAYTRSGDLSSATNLYQCFVESPVDALVPQSMEDISLGASLWRLCDQNIRTLAELLATSWALQTVKMFVQSDIMDVRSAGIASFKSRLVHIHEMSRNSPAGFDHPATQYAVRFLRENEITAYIFGPESHAGLINQSNDITAFLAATATLTAVETDIIWRACCTSVEADFVQAAFGLLSHLTRYLDFHGLLHVLRKYVSTPVEKLGGPAAELLEKWLQELEKRSSDPTDSRERLQLTLTCVDILKHVNAAMPCPVAVHLRRIILVAIRRLAEDRYSLADRAEIYRYILPEVCNMTQHASSSMDVLNNYLNAMSSKDASTVVAMLPVPTAIDELCQYTATSGLPTEVRAHGVNVRLECILRLLGLTQSELDLGTHKRLFDQVFVSSDASSHVRNAAWEKLHAMAANADAKTKAIATQMWTTFMKNFVPAISADLASPMVVRFAALALRGQFSTEDVSQYDKILDAPLWQALVRFATISPLVPVIDAAQSEIINLLFNVPFNARCAPEIISRCHTEFVSALIEALGRVFAEMLQSEDVAPRHCFWHTSNLLMNLLQHSRASLALVQPAMDPSAIVVEECDDASQRVMCEVRVYGADAQPRIVSIEAKSTTKLPILFAKVAYAIGTDCSKVVVGGIDISAASNKTLAEAGLQQAGLIHVVPRYKPTDDINKASPDPGPVERAILDRYAAIVEFLNGPHPAGLKAFQIVSAVRLPWQARVKIVSGETNLNELFPYDKPWRTRYSLWSLQQHTYDLSRVATVDQDFTRRGVQLLTAVVLDEDRSQDLSTLLEVLRVLLLLLRERPTGGHLNPYFTDVESFISRLGALLVEAKEMPRDQMVPHNSDVPLRSELAGLVYQTLLLACQADDSLWDTVATQMDVMASVHTMLLLDEEVDLSERIARQIKFACEDPTVSSRVTSFYWNMLYPVLPQALQQASRSACYFTLLVDLLNVNRTMHSDEAAIRRLTDKLLSYLRSYEHNESPAYIVRDECMVGLLRLLITAVKLLKKFTTNTGLEALPSELTRRLLFPDLEDPRDRPLVDDSSRALVYDLIRSTYTSSTDYHDIVDAAIEAMQALPRNHTASYPGVQDWLRAGCSSTGLSNLGMTCYMNSLLQQLFANLQFRKFILDEPIVDAQRQSVLSILQHLFARMQNSLQPSADTTQLADVLGIHVGVQEDVHTFYTALLSQLEDSMPSQEQKAALTRFFTGKSITQIRGECGHVSSRSEPFTELSITVKNKANLHDSLAEFVQGEPLEGANKYKCMTCNAEDNGRLVNAMKRTCLEDVPDSLTFCLKRFAFDNFHDNDQKVSDKFEFPPEIDMSLYKREHLEDPTAPRDPDMFELVGVILHQGTLSFGHYWSYVRVAGLSYNDPRAWLHVEDSRTRLCTGGLAEVQEQCFGGLTWGDGTERTESGYVLFYQRRSYIARASTFDIVPRELHLSHGILPKVELPKTLAEQIDFDNLWRIRIAGLFHAQFSSFVTWLTAQFSQAVATQRPDSDGMDISDDDRSDAEPADAALVAKVGDLTSQYAFRVLLHDPLAEFKIDSLVAALSAVLKVRPATALHILKPTYKNDGIFVAISNNKNQRIRTTFLGMIHSCLVTLLNSGSEDYEQALEDVTRVHFDALSTTVELMPLRWGDFLGFASNVARQGVPATCRVLDLYYPWVLEILNLPHYAHSQRLHPKVAKLIKSNSIVDLAPLCFFLCDLFGAHVDLSVAPGELEQISSSDKRKQTPRGVSLTYPELEMLFLQADDADVWCLFASTVAHSATNGSWKDYAPGKLIAHLAQHDLLVNHVKQLMEKIFDWEENNLTPLLWSALHFCSVREDGECKGLIHHLSHNFPAWPQNKHCLQFFREAYALAPASVIESVPGWALRNDTFLLHKGFQVRQATARTLVDLIFEPPPLSENAQLDASRIRITRHLLKTCIGFLSKQCVTEGDKAHWRPLTTLMSNANRYLIRLRSAILQHARSTPSASNQGRVSEVSEDRADDEVISPASPKPSPLTIHDALRLLPHEIEVEFHEAATFTEPLQKLLDRVGPIEEFEDTALPTRTAKVRIGEEVDADEKDSAHGDGDESEVEDVDELEDMSSVDEELT